MVSEASADQVRHFYEDRARVATKAGHDLRGERVTAVVVQIVVVARVESRPRTRGPAKQCLRSQARVERVVVENQTRKGGFRKLVRAARCQDVDVVGDSTRVVAFQSLVVDTERGTQRVCRLISHTAIELKQVATTRIERRVLP